MQIVVESMRGRVTPTGDAERYGGTTTIMFSLLVFVFCFVVAFTGLHWKKTLVRDRVAEVAREHGWQPPKSLDSDENFKPEHTLFCRKLIFLAIYALFGDV